MLFRSITTASGVCRGQGLTVLPGVRGFLDKRGYTEEGIRYDKNGNILNLIRRANGNIVDNLVYSYTDNRF